MPGSRGGMAYKDAEKVTVYDDMFEYHDKAWGRNDLLYTKTKH